uniref:Gag/pol polyprotein n=1 Tax=Solanum tuberosum TaxID=4113 RepID=M1B273_SOLTU
MLEKKIVELFVRVQEPEYYDKIMLLVGAKFAEIVKVGETIEDGLRTGKIARVAASPRSSSLLKKKREDVSSISYEGKKTLRKSSSYQGYIHPVGPKPVDTSSRFYRPDQRCACHSNSVGHDTEDCVNLKHKIQDLIDQNVVSLQTVAPNVNSNPLPNHGGATINMIETYDDWCVTKAIVSIAPDELESVVASLSIREKKEFVILTPEKAVALVPRETLTQPKVRHQELVIHGEGSHSDGYALIVHEVSRGCDFYTVELVNVTGDDLAPQHLMPVVYKMIATIILQNGFKPGFGLGKHFQGIVEPIQVPARGVKFGLGYVPTDADKAEMKNKSVDQALARPIPHLYQSFPAREHADDGGLGEGIWGLFEDIDAVIEEEAGTSGIRDAEPDEQMQNWTSTPLLISRSSG